jgi:hypothetical protein
MQCLKFVCRTMVWSLKALWQLPHSAVCVLEQMRNQYALNRREAERLDRIRNPAKYVGKS